MNPAPSPKAGLGQLSGGGFVFTVPLHLVRKLLSAECALLPSLGKSLQFEIAVGMNGRVWVSLTYQMIAFGNEWPANRWTSPISKIPISRWEIQPVINLAWVNLELDHLRRKIGRIISPEIERDDVPGKLCLDRSFDWKSLFLSCNRDSQSRERSLILSR